MGVRHLPVTSLRMFVLTVVRDPIRYTWDKRSISADDRFIVEGSIDSGEM